MRKKWNYIGLGLLFTLLQSCGGETNPVEKSSDTTIESKQISKYSKGEAIYKKTCIVCHQANGKGIEGVFPPLAGSDYLLEDKNRAITQVIHGSEGEIIVNGITYSGIMPPQVLSIDEVKEVVNYTLNSWGNNGGEVSLKEVRDQKEVG